MVARLYKGADGACAERLNDIVNRAREIKAVIQQVGRKMAPADDSRLGRAAR